MSGDKKLFSKATTGALRFWEPMRVLYNLALLIALLFMTFGSSWCFIRLHFPMLVVLAVQANVLYSAAYFPDLILGCSDFRSALRYFRPLLFLLGVLLALFFELCILNAMCVSSCCD